MQKDGTIALSAAEKIERGRTAIAALDAYKAASRWAMKPMQRWPIPY